jgi:hypothetical protein
VLALRIGIFISVFNFRLARRVREAILKVLFFWKFFFLFIGSFILAFFIFPFPDRALPDPARAAAPRSPPFGPRGRIACLRRPSGFPARAGVLCRPSPLPRLAAFLLPGRMWTFPRTRGLWLSTLFLPIF